MLAKRFFVLLLMFSLVGTPAAFAKQISLRHDRWKHTNVYVTTVPLGSHTIHPITSRHAMPMAFETPLSRLHGAVAGANSDFRCGGGLDRRHLAVPQDIFMRNREIWTTGSHEGVAYEQGHKHAWVERARVHLQLTTADGRSRRIYGVNPCNPLAGPTLYTTRAGTSIRAPENQCYTQLSAPSKRWWGPGKETILSRYTVGATRCAKNNPFARPVIASPSRPEFVHGRATLAVNTGHPGVTDIIGGDWLTVSGGKNVAPWRPFGKNCGIQQCPDGYMSGPTPRTELCVSPSGEVGYIIVADGKPGNAAGLTPHQVGRFAVKRVHAGGCINLDGGGSSVMVFHQHQVSHPSYGTERPVIFATGAF